MNLPTGPGFMYLRNKDKFEVKSMLQIGKPSSKQALEWLEYEKWRQECRPYPNRVIKHAYNFGEQKVAGFFVDGFVEVPFGEILDDGSFQPDGTTQTVAYEFLGCHWHFCPWFCCKTEKTPDDGKKDIERLNKIQDKVDALIWIRSCEWERKKNVELGRFVSKNFGFIHESKITEDKILRWIKEKSFFGLVRADVRTPPKVIEEYGHLNFPFIFRKFEVTEDLLSNSMKNLARENGKQFPMETRTLTWNADNIILTTEMIEFYNEIGMQVSNIRWALQYVPSKPFTNFVNKMIDQRIKAMGDETTPENKPLGERAKFCLNSCIGRFG